MNLNYGSTSAQQPAAICYLKSPADAIHILEAVRLGLIPRVTRRLTGHERAMIQPGTVWVWEEEETNMRRWTDGRRWGASRVGGGGFLVYTESTDVTSPAAQPEYGQTSYFPPRKVESLIKQTYSTTMTHIGTGKVKKFHVVAYSSKFAPQGDPHNPLPLPHQLPLLASLKVTPGIWPEWENQRHMESQRRVPTNSSPAPSESSTSFRPSPRNHDFPLISPPLPRGMGDLPPPMNYDRRVPPPMLSPGIFTGSSHPSPLGSPGGVSLPNVSGYAPQSYNDRYYPYPPRAYQQPTESYFEERRDRSPPRPYTQATSTYPYYPPLRDQYTEPHPLDSPYAPPPPPEHTYPIQQIPYTRHTDQPPVHTYSPSMIRLPNGIAPRFPPTPISASHTDFALHQQPPLLDFHTIPDGTAQSPKLSITNSLLNPEASSHSISHMSPANLTLPPLRSAPGSFDGMMNGNGGGVVNGNGNGNGNNNERGNGNGLGVITGGE